MATLGDIVKARQPELWAQLAGVDPDAAPTPGPAVDASAPAPVAAPTMPSPAPSVPSPAALKLLQADPKELEDAQKAASGAGIAANVLRGFREAGNIARGGRAAEKDFSDLEAMRKAPLEAYARRQAAREAANKALIEQVQGAHTMAQTADIPLEAQRKLDTLEETKKYHEGELGARAASTAATIQDTNTRVTQQGYDRALQRELKARELAQDKDRWDKDREARAAALEKKLAELKGAQHNARASGLAKAAASLDAAIADTDAQYQAVKDAGGAGRAAGIASGALSHVPLVGQAAANALFPESTALRGGASAETESTATAVGGGAATQPRMKALEPLAYDPSLSGTALKSRHDIKTQRLKGRREDLQREAASLGITLDTKHGGGGQGASHYKYNDPDPSKATLRIPTDAAGNELGPPEKNQ